MKTGRRSLARAQDLCFIAAVVAFLFAPALRLASGHEEEPTDMVENRRAAEFPEAPDTAQDWAVWPRAFEAWHDDHFGFRARFLRADNALKIFGLCTSPSPRILVGPDHWIFTSGSDIDAWRGAEPFSVAELEAWRRSLESRKTELEKRGIDFHFVLAPSKPEIYPEHLPARYAKGAPSRTEQLTAHFARTSKFVIDDLTDALREEKTRDTGDDYAYFPLGIHWSDRGAAAGARAIVRALARCHPEVAKVDDTLSGAELQDIQGDSWAGRLYLPDRLTQRVRLVVLRDTRELKLATFDEERTVVVDQADATLPRAVVFHDSFGSGLPRLLGRHFSHAVFAWKPDIDLALIERERPDIVIQLLNDRALATLHPQELDTGADTRAREAFEASRAIAASVDIASNTPRIEANGSGRVFVRGQGSAARVVCETTKVSDTFLLPQFELRRGTHAIVHLVFESSVASSASLLFQTDAQRSYDRKRQLHFQTHIGRNEAFVELLEPQLAGRLLFRPAGEVGTFLVEALEVRLAAD